MSDFLTLRMKQDTDEVQTRLFIFITQAWELCMELGV